MRIIPNFVKTIILGLLILSLILAVFILKEQTPHRIPELKTGFYVWQRSWSTPVKQTVHKATDSADEFMVLVGEFDFSTDKPDIKKVSVDWKTFSDTHVPVTLVVRINKSLSTVLSQGGINEATKFLRNFIHDSFCTAREQGVDIQGIQLDYDCPTSKLEGYSQLIARLQGNFPGVEFSITALPTWLKRDKFRKVVKNLSYFVLQAHSLEKPTTINEPIVICRTEKIANYLNKASTVGVPFYLSLPTYGYLVVFDEKGKFAGLCAEGPLPVWQPDYQVHLVISDQQALASVVRELRISSPKNCLGIVWFRLPIDTDKLNWSWTALKTVMDGRIPDVSFSAEVRNPIPDLFEVWMTNTGEKNVIGKVHLDIDWKGQTVQAYDVLGSFQKDKTAKAGGVSLTGPAPALNYPVMVGWFRLSYPANSSETPLNVSQVQVLE